MAKTKRTRIPPAQKDELVNVRALERRLKLAAAEYRAAAQKIIDEVAPQLEGLPVAEIESRLEGLAQRLLAALDESELSQYGKPRRSKH